MLRFPSLLRPALGAVVAAGLLFGASSCDDDPEIVDLLLEVKMMPGGTDYSPTATYTINGKAVSFSTLRFYLHDPAVSDGSTSYSTDAYVLATPGSSTFQVGQVMNQAYSGFTFNFGIDSATNHADPSLYDASNVLAPQSPNMHWSWASGYIFLRIDGQFDSDGDGTPDTDFEAHLGTDNFYTPITLDGDFEAHDDHIHVELAFDPIALFDGFDFGADAGDPSTHTTHTMDNMPMAMAMRGNLSNAFSLLAD